MNATTPQLRHNIHPRSTTSDTSCPLLLHTTSHTSNILTLSVPLSHLSATNSSFTLPSLPSSPLLSSPLSSLSRVATETCDSLGSGLFPAAQQTLRLPSSLTTSLSPPDLPPELSTAAPNVAASFVDPLSSTAYPTAVLTSPQHPSTAPSLVDCFSHPENHTNGPLTHSHSPLSPFSHPALSSPSFPSHPAPPLFYLTPSLSSSPSSSLSFSLSSLPSSSSSSRDRISVNSTSPQHHTRTSHNDPYSPILNNQPSHSYSFDPQADNNSINSTLHNQHSSSHPSPSSPSTLYNNNIINKVSSSSSSSSRPNSIIITPQHPHNQSHLIQPHPSHHTHLLNVHTSHSSGPNMHTLSFTPHTPSTPLPDSSLTIIESSPSSSNNNQPANASADTAFHLSASAFN
jgi:hypothetical protein